MQLAEGPKRRNQVSWSSPPRAAGTGSLHRSLRARRSCSRVQNGRMAGHVMKRWWRSSEGPPHTAHSPPYLSGYIACSVVQGYISLCFNLNSKFASVGEVYHRNVWPQMDEMSCVGYERDHLCSDVGALTTPANNNL